MVNTYLDPDIRGWIVDNVRDAFLADLKDGPYFVDPGDVERVDFRTLYAWHLIEIVHSQAVREVEDIFRDQKLDCAEKTRKTEERFYRLFVKVLEKDEDEARSLVARTKRVFEDRWTLPI